MRAPSSTFQYFLGSGYAVDICFLLHPHTDMQVKLNRLIHEVNLACLKINVNKTKYMRVGTNILTKFHVYNEPIKMLLNSITSVASSP